MGRVGGRGEGVRVAGDDACVGEDKPADVSDGCLEPRLKCSIADCGDLAGLVGSAAEGGSEEGEGGRRGGGRVREG